MLPAPLFRSLCRGVIRAPGLSLELRDQILRNLARVASDPRYAFSMGHRTFRVDMRHTYHRLMALGHYERETVDLFRQILREGSTYCDLGAEIGYFAAQAELCVGPSGHLHLFEPDPAACARLKETFYDTPFITINQAACSESAGELTLHLAGTSGQSSLEVPPPGASSDSVAVTTLRLDDYLESKNIDQIDLLKIDIEGHEVSALSGVVKSLRTGRIKSIVIEKNNGLLWAAGFSSLHLHSLIMSCNFTGYTEKGKVISKTDLDNQRLENFIYIHESAHPPQSFAAPATPAFFSATHAAEALDPKYPGHQVNQCIDLARYGNVSEAIRTAKALLREHPELEDLKGHCAYWEKGTR